MSTDHDILKVTKQMVADLGCNMADLSSTVGRQQSALIRTLDNNPSVRILQEVAWALGLGKHPDPQGNIPSGPPHWYWLCVPMTVYRQSLGVSYRPNHNCPMMARRADKENRKLTKYATYGRGPDYDPTDKSHLSQVYPAKALAGAGPDGAPVDSRFIEAPALEPLHGKTTQGPGGAARQDLNLSGHRHVAGDEFERVQAGPIEGSPLTHANDYNEQPESLEQRQQRLSSGTPQGYRLSPKALADAPRTPYGLWLKGGWDVDRLIEHGYLEVDSSTPPANDTRTDAEAIGETIRANNRQLAPEARRLEASIGCPEGWILSDKALEISDDVTYDLLRKQAHMSDETMKEEKHLVPRAWLGYD